MSSKSLIDLMGKQFGKWTVISRGPKSRQSLWTCQCTCGAIHNVQGGDLRSGRSTGCKQCREYNGVPKHGKYKTPEYAVWAVMLHRCFCNTAQQYHNYGGRGIRVCDRWKSFELFLEDMGRRPSPKYSIDRIDNDGDYEPSNCRWATITTQRRNTRKNRLITFNGVTKCITEWALQFGMHKQTLLNRINADWSIKRAFNTPVQHQKKPNRH